jgi:hypothetical protein
MVLFSEKMLKNSKLDSQIKKSSRLVRNYILTGWAEDYKGIRHAGRSVSDQDN